MSEQPEDKPPIFVSLVPSSLLKGLHPKDRWLYEQASITNQQILWLMEKAVEAKLRDFQADGRMTKIETRLTVIEDLKKILTARWSVVAYIVAGVVSPFLVGLLGAWVKSKF